MSRDRDLDEGALARRQNANNNDAHWYAEEAEEASIADTALEEVHEDRSPWYKGAYQPPGRLVLFELTAFVLLVYLLMGNPIGGSLGAISSDGKGGVGLLSTFTSFVLSSSFGRDAKWS